jgi:carboxyl-terminal processing protease
MKSNFSLKKIVGHIFLNLMLALILILNCSTVAWATTYCEDVLPEIRALLHNHYAEPVSSEVLTAPNIDEMLKRLGDPYTEYFTPEQYQNFVGNIDFQFSGIGIRIEMQSEGVKVVSVVPGSPAEEVGLKPGDVIVCADGQSMAGLSSDQAVSLLRGVEGSTVQISIRRGSEKKELNITRRVIKEPTVTCSLLDGHIGYIGLKSFGSNTPKDFESAVMKLSNENVDSWIIDLRDNAGGYLSSALELAGYFIGPDITVQVKNRAGDLYFYKAPRQPFTLNQPIIFLINKNSASAAEILTAAVKDYHKASIMGTTTYGKGTVQNIFELSNGGVFKMTVEQYYSPFGYKIDKVGITPDVMIAHADSLKAAELRLSDKTVALAKARTLDYWEAWGEICNSVYADEKSERFSFYYPSYRKVSELSAIPLDKKFIVHFSGAVDRQSVNDNNFELINSETGERILAKYEVLGPSDVQVIPHVFLDPNTTYWLVIHPSVRDVYGLVMKEGAVAVAHTIE